MISVARPSESAIEALLASGSRPGGGFDATYAEVGATDDGAALAALASRYTIDRRRFDLGKGRPLFESACRAMFEWRHFEIPWLELQGGAAGVRTGMKVATLTRVAGLWFLNPCTVVYRSAPDSGGSAAGAPASVKAAVRSAVSEACFAYGTAAGHAACGEERFSLFHDRASDRVSFEILAFSRPATLLARVGRPLLRRIQRRFALDAARALARACAAPCTTEIGTD